MANLVLPGIVGGMGQGLSQGLTQMNAGIIQQGLQDSDRAFQMEKLKVQMDHAEALQAKSEEGANARAQLQAGTTLTTAGMQKDTVEGQGDLARKAASENLGKEIGSRKEIATDTNTIHKEIAKMSNYTHEKIAGLERDLKDKHFDRTFTAAKLTATTSTIASVKDDVRYLRTLLMNPLLKNDPAYPAMVEELKASVGKLNGFEAIVAQLVGGSATVDKEVAAKVSPPGFNPPPGMEGPPQATTPVPQGMIQTPPPSAAQLELMRQATQ